MAAQFAIASDVAARWRPLSSAETALADQLCEDASDIIRVRWPGTDNWITDGSLRAESVTRIVATMVKRAMLVGDKLGVEMSQEVAGPFQARSQYANPSANLYLTAEEVALFEPESNIGHTGRAYNGFAGTRGPVRTAWSFDINYG